MEVDEIIDFQIALAKKIIKNTGDGSFPIEFQLSIYDQCNRDIRMNKINNNKNNNGKKATVKQKKLMDDLDIDYKEDVDVKTASMLIGEALNKG